MKDSHPRGVRNRQESLRWPSLRVTFQARCGDEMQLSVQREPGLRVHREEDPGESSTERTRRPAGSGETALAPFLSRECRPSAVSEELLRPGKGPPEEAGGQHSAHGRSRAAPTPTSLRPGGNPQHRGGHGQRPLPPAWDLGATLSTGEVTGSARSHQPA